jgi:hypothetical protein
MKTANRNIANLLFIMLALFFLEGERALLSTVSDFHVVTSENHTNDIEIPNNHCLFDTFEEECFVSGISFKISTNQNNTPLDLMPMVIVQKELPASIWQPPKLV